jgi:hypothetical protein
LVPDSKEKRRKSTELMKKFSPIWLILIFTLNLSAQTNTKENSFLLSPRFEMGDKKIYHIKDKYRVETNPLFPATAENEYEVSFMVVDTTDGYTIAYENSTLSTENKNWTLESIKAEISSGLSLQFKLEKTGAWKGLLNPESARLSLIKKLDSIIAHRPFSDNEKAAILIFRGSLNQKQGIGLFTKHIHLFSSSFSRPRFYTHKTFHSDARMYLLGQPALSGVLITHMGKRKSKQITLETEFIGNKDSAAKYYTPIFLSIFADINNKQYRNPRNLPSEMKYNNEISYVLTPMGWPILEIHYKSVEFFVEKNTSWTTMILKDFDKP